MRPDLLNTYINDHLGGAVVALQLLDRLIETAADTEWRQFFGDLRDEIGEDKRTLEGLLHRIGGKRSMARHVGGWVTEKLGRAKLQFDDPVAGSLQRLQAIETLALGIQGKLALWRALAEMAPELPQLGGEDFGQLARRAESQHTRVEARRLMAARNLVRQRDLPQPFAPSREPRRFGRYAAAIAALAAVSLVARGVYGGTGSPRTP